MPGLRFWRLGVWASGALTATGPDFHSVALWRQPAQMSLDYEALKGEDPLFRQSAASPGRPVRASARRAMPTGFRLGMVVPPCAASRFPDGRPCFWHHGFMGCAV